MRKRWVMWMMCVLLVACAAETTKTKTATPASKMTPAGLQRAFLVAPGPKQYTWNNLVALGLPDFRLYEVAKKAQIVERGHKNTIEMNFASGLRTYFGIVEYDGSIYGLYGAATLPANSQDLRLGVSREVHGLVIMESVKDGVVASIRFYADGGFLQAQPPSGQFVIIEGRDRVDLAMCHLDYLAGLQSDARCREFSP